MNWAKQNWSRQNWAIEPSLLDVQRRQPVIRLFDMLTADRSGRFVAKR